MKTKLSVFLITIIGLSMLISSCKKGGGNSNMQLLQINSQNNGKTIAVSKGQSLRLTLKNPGDGGYSFDTPQYNSSVLSLTGHTHSSGASSAVGGFGDDAWEFKALKTGESTLVITATRPFDKNNPVVMFSGKVTAN